MRSLFAERDIRCTRQRVEVYAALAAVKSHPTAEQLHRMVQSTSPGTSLATVYNTLEALCEAGLARKLPNAEGGARYDADMSDHLHAVTADGQVVDVPADLGRDILMTIRADLLARLEGRLGEKIRHLSVQFG
ncbi:MAG: transcriptional repressor [Planctomycetota bacterium]|nr:transcriptional repressor [Planctomycetota bacterium]